MPTPAVSLRFRRFKRGLGIAAPKVEVRSVWPRQFVFLLTGIGLLLVAGFVALLVGRVADPDVAELRAQLEHHRQELASLKSVLDTGENSMGMERAKQQELVRRMRDLEHENVVLKEELLIFERLVPLTGTSASAKIENFRISPDAEGGYRYRLLLAFQPPRKEDIFRGDYLLKVNLRRKDGGLRSFSLPEKPETAVEVKRFLRREGRIPLQDGETLISVEARLFQGGKLLAEQLLKP